MPGARWHRLEALRFAATARPDSTMFAAALQEDAMKIEIEVTARVG